MQPFAEARLLQCPYCGEPVELDVEPWGPHAETYTEDCPVCCRPWRVQVQRDGDEVLATLEREDG
jgi:hypothetical protein